MNAKGEGWKNLFFAAGDAKNLKLRERGMLKPGYFADVVVFDPETIADKATYTQPMQYAVGVSDVFVNGEHAGAKPGQVVREPGWTGGKPQKTSDRARLCCLRACHQLSQT
jgi:N-acyl-D-aspartate/D-glutamate deacylase